MSSEKERRYRGLYDGNFTAVDFTGLEQRVAEWQVMHDDAELTDDDYDADLDADSERSRGRELMRSVDTYFVRSTPPRGELIWEAKDGRRTPIKEMATAHLVNAVRLIQLHRGWRQEFLEPMMKELNKRGAGQPYDSGGTIRAVRHSDKYPSKLARNGKGTGFSKGR